jgi:integrin beta 8
MPAEPVVGFVLGPPGVVGVVGAPGVGEVGMPGVGDGYGFGNGVGAPGVVGVVPGVPGPGVPGDVPPGLV